jgi:hypothetical protein
VLAAVAGSPAAFAITALLKRSRSRPRAAM